MNVRSVALVVLLVVFPFAAAAQTAVPSPEEFLGYAMGERFTPHHTILGYFEELDRRSDLVALRQIGESYEHRPLVLATITSAKNHAMLDAIRQNALRLAAGEGTADALVRDMPVVVWLAFGVHGNESSSAEAAMLVASNLLRDAESTRLLDDVVVIIDPLENPDGRERYTEWFRRSSGVKANPNPDALEHQEPWPGGRYNHYLIDMNRDWAWMSQKETQARAAAYQQWYPQVFVDFHEMSAQSSYFFPPDAKPINVNLPKDVEHWLEVFGRAHAEEFSRRNWPFFVAEHFDLFYPGYGDSWPSLHGAIGMTYEMAGGGRAGSTVRRDDGSVLTLRDRVLRHATTGMSTIRTAAQNREALLRYTHAAARTQLEGGRQTFLIVPGSPNFDALVGLLEKQGVRLEMLTAPATIRASRVDRDGAESRSFPAGTVVVSTRQPLGGLATTLLERAAALHDGFLDEQRARAEADEPDQFYDLTAWSLPLAMNVEAWSTSSPVANSSAYRREAPATFRPASYGYLVDGLDPDVYRFAGRLLADGIRFNVLDSAVTASGNTLSRGSIIVLKGNNAADLDTRLSAIVSGSGVTVTPLDSGWLGGIGFGSDKVRHVRDPKIALVGGPGSNATSFGMLWHTLDVDTPIPHTIVNAESIRNLDLSRYEVLVFPDGSYGERLGKRGLEKVKQWVADGGTLVAVKGAGAFLTEKDYEVSKLKKWEAPKSKDDEEGDAAPEQRYFDFRVPGSAFRTSMNERSFLTFGLPRPPAVLVEGSGAYKPLPHRTDNILTIDGADPLLSGVAWPESIERLSGSPYVTSEKSGRGQVITFADDPHFRLFWRGTLPLFLNAVLYGPSFGR